jgi:hypothetical protein
VGLGLVGLECVDGCHRKARKSYNERFVDSDVDIERHEQVDIAVEGCHDGEGRLDRVHVDSKVELLGLVHIGSLLDTTELTEQVRFALI